MKRNAKAAAEVTIMVRLRFVSRYFGICCEKKFMFFFYVSSESKAKSTDFLAEIRTFWHFFWLKAEYYARLSYHLRVEETLDAALRRLLEGLFAKLYKAYFAICGQFGIDLL